MSQTTTNEIRLETLNPSSALNDVDIGASATQDPIELDDGTVLAPLSRGRAVTLISILTGVTIVSSFSTGLLTVGLPSMAPDINLQNNLLLWPASVYALTTGCTLILAGSIADHVGSRFIFLLGCFLQGVFVLACGLAKTGIQLIMFRAIQGITLSLCLPTAISIITNAFPNGRSRTFGLAFMGAGQPLGFSLGLVLSGLFIGTIGWRWGYYMCAGANEILFAVSIWGIPPDSARPRFSWISLYKDIDWVGAILASTCLGLLSYVLAAVTGSQASIREPANIALLTIALAIIPTFVIWVGRQERLSRPALIPNSIWKNTAFTSVCLTVLMSWAVNNVIEWFSTLFFQEVQHLSALGTSLRFLPSVVVGAFLNVITAFICHKYRADYLIVISSLFCAISPLLMALINPAWPYWYSAFWAMFLSPVSVDVLFTVSALVITSVFPDKTQALAGAVFQTMAQFGTSLGLAITASISASVTDHSKFRVKTSPDALMAGYRATFWVSFGWMLLACAIGGLGLRNAGKVGLKRD